MRWDLIDKFQVLKKGRFARAVKTFHGDEDFFLEHFAGRALVPEPLMVEMVAQTGGVLYGLDIDFKKEVILAKIGSAEFFREMPPPCQLEVEAKIDEEREEGAWISGIVSHEGQTVAAVTLMLVSMEGLDGVRKEKIVFNEGFLKHFGVYEVARASEGIA